MSSRLSPPVAPTPGVARELHEGEAVEIPHVATGVVVRVHAARATVLRLVEGHQIQVDG